MLFNEFYQKYQNIKNNPKYTTQQKQILLRELSGIIFCQSELERDRCYSIQLECPLMTFYPPNF